MAKTFEGAFKNLTVFKMGKKRGGHCSWLTLLLRELSLHI